MILWKRKEKANEEILKLKELIEKKKDLVMYDEEGFIEFLDELSKELARIIKESSYLLSSSLWWY